MVSRALGRRGGAGNKGVELWLIKIAEFESNTGCAEKEVHHSSLNACGSSEV